MPFYDYRCDKCVKTVEVLKDFDESGRAEECEDCGETMRRLYSANIHLMHTKVQDAEFNPGLGTVTKSRQHREEIAKERGLIEVGSESAESLAREEAKQVQYREERVKREWERL